VNFAFILRLGQCSGMIIINGDSTVKCNIIVHTRQSIVVYAPQWNMKYETLLMSRQYFCVFMPLYMGIGRWFLSKIIVFLSNNSVKTLENCFRLWFKKLQCFVARKRVHGHQPLIPLIWFLYEMRGWCSSSPDNPLPFLFHGTLSYRELLMQLCGRSVQPVSRWA
jgi:hypothetical protein